MREEIICDKCGKRIEGEVKVSEELGEIIISHSVCPTATITVLEKLENIKSIAEGVCLAL